MYKMDKYTYEQETNAKRPAGFLTGLFLGGVAGAVTALLFAPQSGQETRQQIQQKAIKVSEEAADRVDEVVSQARSKTGQVKANLTEKARDLKNQGRDALVEQLDRVSNAAESGKRAIQGKDDSSS
jgi:gas vesicle protein